MHVGDYYYEDCCPICGCGNTTVVYLDPTNDIGEVTYSCIRCGYVDEFAYGYYKTIVGNKEFAYSCYDSNSKQERIKKKIHRAIFMARRNYRKFKKMP